jgi:hypothetical protein
MGSTTYDTAGEKIKQISTIQMLMSSPGEKVKPGDDQY